MNILKYVTELLQSETEVSINGLGTFSKNKTAGRFDHESGSFLPPSTTLRFEEGTADSEKLQNFIADQENIDSETAKKEIEAFSVATMNSLRNGTEVSLEALGTFNYENNSIHFIPGSIDDLDDDFFGFPEIQEKDLPLNSEEKELHASANADAEEEEEPENTEISEVENFESETTETIDEGSNIETVVPFNDGLEVANSSNELTEPEAIKSEPATEAYIADRAVEENEYEEPKSSLLKWFIIVFLIVVAAVLLFMAKPELWDKISGHNEVDTLSQQITPVLDTAKKDSALYDTKVVGDTLLSTPVLKDTTTYEIIVSAEKNQERIDRMLINYERLGYKAKVLPGKILKKISVGSYATKSEALDSLDVVRKKLKNPEAYVYPHHN